MKMHFGRTAFEYSYHRQVTVFPALQLHFIDYENVIHVQPVDIRFTMAKQRTSEPCSSELHFNHENMSIEQSQQATQYVKVVFREKVYYIHESAWPKVSKNDECSSAFINQLMLFSDFVVDRATNQIIKCRQTCENVLDKFCGV